jgi:hypothetical protein
MERHPDSRGHRWAGFANAGSDFVFAMVYLAAWIKPSLLWDGAPLYLMAFLFIELMITVGTLFIGGSLAAAEIPLAQRIIPAAMSASLIIGVSVAAAVIVGYLGLIAVFGLALLRNLSFAFGPAGAREKDVMGITLFSSLAIYVFLLVVTSNIPLPPLGLTAPVNVEGIASIWEDEPYRAMAFGFSYYSAIGALQISRIFTTPPLR